MTLEGDRESELSASRARVLERIVRGHPLEDVLVDLCDLAEVLGKGHARLAILLIDPEARRVRTTVAPKFPRALCAAVEGEPIDTLGDPTSGALAGVRTVTLDLAGSRPSSVRDGLVAAGFVAAAAVPIRASDGVVLGALCGFSPVRRPPDEVELRRAEEVAALAALAIEHHRADLALRESEARHRFLTALDAATQPLTDPTQVMATTARLLAEHLDVDRCAYADVDDERVFDITGDHARGVQSIVGRWDVAAFGPDCVAAMLAGRPFVVDDSEADPRVRPEDLVAYRATAIRAVICVPLHKAGVFTAAMAVHQKVPRSWTRAEVALVATVVARCWETLERARVTRTLQQSETRYRTIVEASPDAVCVVDGDGSLLQLNAAGRRMLDTPGGAEVEGTSVLPRIAVEHRDAFRALLDRTCGGEGGRLRFDVLTFAGRRLTVEAYAAPLSTARGCVQLALVRDVTEQAAWERALAESRARLDYAARVSGVAFWYCDLPFDELQWDDRAKELAFLPPDARVTVDTFYERLHPDDRDRVRAAVEHALAEHELYDVTYRNVDPATGAVNWVHSLGRAVYAPDGTPTRFDGVVLDVTAQHRDQEHLARVAAQLREHDRRKDEFLATLAHELRNPLAPIRTGLDLLQRGLPEDRARATREMIARQLGHLVRMVDDLLDISRVTLGKVTLAKQHVDLRTVLASALETARPVVEANGHHLEVHVVDGPLPLEVDPTRLAQVVGNLLNNAAKYTPRGGRITLDADRLDGHVRIRVADDGIGIPADMLPRVFDMFTQIEPSIDRAQGGLGIGLTLVRRLVEMHGGTVEAASPGRGQGSTFTVQLPLGQAVDAPAQEARDAPGGTGLTVLVVDDNRDAAEALAMLLELSGHTTHLAHAGPEAVQAVEAVRPDVVLLDIGLPGFDGYEVARRVRASGITPQPRLVALTGWGSEEDRRRAREAGFDEHLVKPVDIGRLEAVIAAVAEARG